jgi:hypothetical protein
MSKAIKNLELFYDSKPQVIAHQKPSRFDGLNCRPQDINLWKIFSKVPRTSSLRPTEGTEEENLLEEERLIVISTFKNAENSN